MVYVWFVAGIILLIKSADFLIDGASSLAHKVKIPDFIIGLTIVAFGTSLPELIVNILAATSRHGNIAFGNIIGSNMANTTLIFGLMAMVTVVEVEHSTARKELPYSILAIILLMIFASLSWLRVRQEPVLTRMEGMILMALFLIFLAEIIFRSGKSKALKIHSTATHPKPYSGLKVVLLITAGVTGLFWGGKWTVEGAIYIAQASGMSEYLISATIVAVGSSLPELVTSVRAALKKRGGMAVGNLIGSNIFNVMWVLGLTAIIKSLPFPTFLNIELLILLMASMLLWLFVSTGAKRTLGKREGAALLLIYVGYIVFISVRG